MRISLVFLQHPHATRKDLSLLHTAVQRRMGHHKQTGILVLRRFPQYELLIDEPPHLILLLFLIFDCERDRLDQMQQSILVVEWERNLITPYLGCIISLYPSFFQQVMLLEDILYASAQLWIV